MLAPPYQTRPHLRQAPPRPTDPSRVIPNTHPRPANFKRTAQASRSSPRHYSVHTSTSHTSTEATARHLPQHHHAEFRRTSKVELPEPILSKQLAPRARSQAPASKRAGQPSPPTKDGPTPWNDDSIRILTPSPIPPTPTAHALSTYAQPHAEHFSSPDNLTPEHHEASEKLKTLLDTSHPSSKTTHSKNHPAPTDFYPIEHLQYSFNAK